MSTSVAPNPLAEGLYDYRVAEPAIMVIFGATGDLSGRKLLPPLLLNRHRRGQPISRIRLMLPMPTFKDA